MRILVVSDVVDNRIYSEKLKENFGDVDLVLSAGDLPFSYLEYIVSILNKPLLYVNGNHNNTGEYTSDGHIKKECLGCMNVHSKTVLAKGILVAGLEGSYRYNKGTCQYTEAEMWFQYVKLIPKLILNRLFHGRYCDILLTHAPPLGIGDSVNPAHKGFGTFLRFMRRFSPKIHIHGHVHLYDRNEVFIHDYRGTTVINAYNYKVFDFDVKTGSIKVLRH